MNRESLEKIRRRRVDEMSRHDGVSCDACMKSNFKGRRFKCLRCYDYDLCASCFEQGATTSRHSLDHPVQCILSRTDFELYYGGENSSEVNHALTCPLCGRLGFTESELQSHVASEHQNCNTEVVCPICASIPGGEPNLVTDDLASHLTLEHRQPRERGEDGGASRPSVRRVQQPSSRTLGIGRGRGRPNMHFSSGGLSPSGGRDPVDPIAELLSQLSGVRRAAVPYDRLLHPRHGAGSGSSSQAHTGLSSQTSAAIGTARRSVFPPPSANQVIFAEPSGGFPQQVVNEGSSSKSDRNQFLLDKCLDSQRRKDLSQDQSLFLQDLLLSTLTLKDKEEGKSKSEGESNNHHQPSPPPPTPSSSHEQK